MSVQPMADLTQERLKEILHYCPGTGIWTHLVSNGSAKKGNRAGKLVKARGRTAPYWRLSIDSHEYRSGRLAYFYMQGSWPDHEIDHKDRNSLNDAWDNLRSATRNQNEANKSFYKNNSSGFKGVHPEQGKWRARIRRNGKRISLGYFDSPTIAAEAYKRAEAVS